MSRPPIIRAFLADEVIADSFAGGGGASLGIELALGRSPDIAVNHDAEAIAMHAANHPTTRHYTESVWEVDPRRAADGKPVALAWFSPDCKHHSKAKGGKPREQKIRGLAWVAVTWAQRVRPRVICLENVEEFQDWGPLHRSGPSAGSPIRARKGETFRAFVGKLRRLGYIVEHRLLGACDYGAPTTRRRLFLIARCDGRPIVWPSPTHGPAASGRAHRHRTAAEIIDWSIPCPSIFERDRPLADKTLARIARGIRKFVLENPRPFVVSVNHGGDGARDSARRLHDTATPLPTITAGGGQYALVSPVIVKAKTHGGGGNDAMSAEEPLRTVTASKRGEFALVAPYLVHRSNGERPGQAPRIYDAERPLGTIVAQGQKHALCAAFLAKHYGDRPTGGFAGGSSLHSPIGTTTVRDHHALVAAHLTKMYGTSTGSDVADPAPTITANGRGGGHIAAVAAFLVRYNGTGDAESAQLPLGTLTTKPRFGLVTVTIDGEEYVIVDIGMRMLTPRELFRAQGFTEEYAIDPIGAERKTAHQDGADPHVRQQRCAAGRRRDRARAVRGCAVMPTSHGRRPTPIDPADRPRCRNCDQIIRRDPARSRARYLQRKFCDPMCALAWFDRHATEPTSRPAKPAADLVGLAINALKARATWRRRRRAFDACVLSHVSSLTPRSPAEIHAEVLDDWGSVSKRTVYRSIARHRRAGRIVRTGEGYVCRTDHRQQRIAA